MEFEQLNATDFKIKNIPVGNICFLSVHLTHPDKTDKIKMKHNGQLIGIYDDMETIETHERIVTSDSLIVQFFDENDNLLSLPDYIIQDTDGNPIICQTIICNTIDFDLNKIKNNIICFKCGHVRLRGHSKPR